MDSIGFQGTSSYLKGLSLTVRLVLQNGWNCRSLATNLTEATLLESLLELKIIEIQ